MTNRNNARRETRARMGKIIKEARLKKNLTQSELGKMLGKSDNVITNWEKGTNSPDVDNIERLCAILDIPVDYMFQAKQKEKSPSMELGEDEQYLVESYRKLSHDDQVRVIERIDTILELSAASEEHEDKVKRA